MSSLLRYYVYADASQGSVIPLGPDVLVEELPILEYGTLTDLMNVGSEEPQQYRVASSLHLKRVPHPSESEKNILLYELLLVKPEDWEQTQSSTPIYIIGGRKVE